MEINSILSLSLGLIAGVMFAIIWSKYEDFSTVLDTRFQSFSESQENDEEGRIERMKGFLHGQKINNISHADSSQAGASNVNEPLKYGINGKSYFFRFNQQDPNSNMGSLTDEQMEIAKWQMFDSQYDADKLKSAFSVFCIITIGKSQIQTYGKPLFHSWTTRCNDFIMLSNTDDGNYKVKNEGMPEGPANSWERTKKAMSYAVKNHPNHDWYVKLEHDVFLVVENYRYMLLLYQAQIQGFAGHVLTGRNQRGSVVSLSKEAAVKAVEIFPNCGSLYGGKEDFKELEACLKRVSIKSSEDGRDSQGVCRFQMVVAKPSLPMNAHSSLDWSWRYIDNPEKMGEEDCCRDYPVSFHNLNPNGMYLMDYMVYHMRPFGIGNYICPADQGAGKIGQPA